MSRPIVYSYTSDPRSALTSVSGSAVETQTYGPGGDYGVLPPTGTAVDAGFGTANNLGDYTTGAVHNGSDNRGFYVAGGLASALGGQDAHGLEFTGAEEQCRICGGPGWETTQVYPAQASGLTPSLSKPLSG